MRNWLDRIDNQLGESDAVEWLDRDWAFVRRTGFVLWVTRGSLVMMVLTVAIFLSDQVSDAAVQLSESGGR